MVGKKAGLGQNLPGVDRSARGVSQNPGISFIDFFNLSSPASLAPDGAILYTDVTKNKPLLPVTYNGKYLVVKNV